MVRDWRERVEREKEIRQQIFDRFQGHCGVCGSHVNCRIYYRNNEKREDVNGGICLCGNCFRIVRKANGIFEELQNKAEV